MPDLNAEWCIVLLFLTHQHIRCIWMLQLTDFRLEQRFNPQHLIIYDKLVIHLYHMSKVRTLWWDSIFFLNVLEQKGEAEGNTWLLNYWSLWPTGRKFHLSDGVSYPQIKSFSTFMGLSNFLLDILYSAHFNFTVSALHSTHKEVISLQIKKTWKCLCFKL